MKHPSLLDRFKGQTNPRTRHAHRRTNLFTLTKNKQSPDHPKDSRAAVSQKGIRSLSPPTMSIHSNHSLNTNHHGGGGRVRTDDPLLAKQVLSQLSYAPISVIGTVTRKHQNGGPGRT